jgi:hypothetical protein
MILFEIDTESVSGVEFECDAPRAIDVNRVTRGNKSLQSVKIEPGKVHLFRRGRGIQAIKSDQDAFVHLDIDLSGATFRPQVGKRLASERLDHVAV